MSDKVVVYGKDTWPHTNDAREALKKSGREIEYYDAMGYENVDPQDLPAGAMREGYDYYMTARAGTERFPNYSHLGVANDLEAAFLVNAVDYAPYLYTPYLGIYGSKAVSGPLTQMFFDAASEPKELYIVDGATHVSLYDVDQDVERAVVKMDEFFQKHAG